MKIQAAADEQRAHLDVQLTESVSIQPRQQRAHLEVQQTESIQTGQAQEECAHSLEQRATDKSVQS